MIANPGDGDDDARYAEVATRERARTMTAIDSLPSEIHRDVLGLWRTIQEAVNAYVAAEGRAIDERVLPTVLRLQADECDRIVHAAREAN